MINFKINENIFFIGGETHITNGIIMDFFTQNESIYADIKYFDCGEIKTISFPVTSIYKTFDDALNVLVDNLKGDIFLISSLKENDKMYQDIIRFKKINKD